MSMVADVNKTTRIANELLISYIKITNNAF